MKTRAVRTSLVLLPLTASLLCACMSSTAPLPDGSRRFAAPAVFSDWWTMAESCSGKTGDFRAIDWWVVPGVVQFAHEGTMVSGLWTGENRVVIAEGAIRDGRLVRHEMLHALTKEVRHTREAFLDDCAGTVVCLLGCLEDAGPPPVVGPSVARVLPGDMIVDVAINPTQPDRRISDGNFRLRVTVSNPRTDSVLVMLPSSGGVPPESFNFRVSGGPNGVWFTEHAWDPGILVFAPGVSRYAVFDFRVGDKFDGFRTLPEGTYEVRGGFGSATSVTRTFVVRND